MTFFTKYGPAPCDKKYCSEQQTLFCSSGGSGNETRLSTGSKWTTRKCDVFKFHLGSYLDPGVLNFCFSCPPSFCPPMEEAGVAGWLASGGAGVLAWGFLPDRQILSSRRLISSDNCRSEDMRSGLVMANIV